MWMLPLYLHVNQKSDNDDDDDDDEDDGSSRLSTLMIDTWRSGVNLFDLGLTSLSTFFSDIATVSGCGRELNAHF